MTVRIQTAAVVGVAALGLLPALFLFGLITAVSTGLLGGCGVEGVPTIAGNRSWTAEQSANARTITSVVATRQLPQRAAVLAVTTAIVESGLHNHPFGDRDSLGLFQQRPSQGWGTPATVLNPALATAAFLDHLVAIPGWSVMTPGMAEQLVQRSAFPERYALHEAAAAALVAISWPSVTTPDVGVARLAAIGLGQCPDYGGSDVPLPPDAPGGTTQPPGFLLPADPRARLAVDFAVAQLGKPYVWGATGPSSFDCSGLVQAAWAAAEVPISRTTASQVHDGRPVSDLRGLRPGDLLFIPGDHGTAARPGHVGLYIGSTEGGEGLVIDAYDSRHGVIVEPLSSWAPKTVAIRRVSGTAPQPGGDLP